MRISYTPFVDVHVFVEVICVKDELYGIAMQNADRYGALARSAEGRGDDELAGFFRRMRDENRRSAEEAKRLLAQRVAE